MSTSHYRPALERLEKREVFSVAPLAGVLPIPTDNEMPSAEVNVSPYMEQDNVYKLSTSSGLLAGTFGRGVLAGDFNQDGRPDPAELNGTSAAGITVDPRNRDLAATDALFSQAGDRQGIIAILIGMIHAEKNQDIEVENDETHLAALDLNDLYLLGDNNGDADVDAADYVVWRTGLNDLIARTTR